MFKAEKKNVRILSRRANVQKENALGERIQLMTGYTGCVSTTFAE